MHMLTPVNHNFLIAPGKCLTAPGKMRKWMGCSGLKFSWGGKKILARFARQKSYRHMSIFHSHRYQQIVFNICLLYLMDALPPIHPISCYSLYGPMWQGICETFYLVMQEGKPAGRLKKG